MTQRGTLAYYLAAWVIGCFIAALLAWCVGAWYGAYPVNASALLTEYFLSLIFGAADALLFAFLLRRLMHSLHTHSLWIWLLSGAGLAAAVIGLLIAAAHVSPTFGAAMEQGSASYVGWIFFAAPRTLRDGGLWQAPLDGAATAVVLCLVDRAFNRPDVAPQGIPSDVKQSPV